MKKTSKKKAAPAASVYTTEQLVLRLEPKVKLAVRRAAEKQGTSINAWVETVLAKATGVTI